MNNENRPNKSVKNLQTICMENVRKSRIHRQLTDRPTDFCDFMPLEISLRLHQMSAQNADIKIINAPKQT